MSNNNKFPLKQSRAFRNYPRSAAALQQQPKYGDDAAEAIPGLKWHFEAAAGGSVSLTVSPATVAITGQSVSLRSSRQITASPATVAISGQSVALATGRKIAVTQATVAASGQSVTLKAGRQLLVSPATVAISGQSVALRTARALSVTPATVAIVGQSVDLNYTPTASVGSSSGVRRLEQFRPQESVVGRFFQQPTPKLPDPIVKDRPKPITLKAVPPRLPDITQDVERLDRKAKQTAKALARAEAAIARVTEMEAKARTLDAVREAKKITHLRKQIEAEDEAIIMALLAA